MDLSSLTLSQLRYLVAVDHQRSFRRAAEQCHVSQPALSMQISKLEQVLGARVFDRSRQPVVPTDLGTAIIAQARRVLAEADQIERVVGQARSGALSGPYRLGVIPTLAPTLLPRILPLAAERLPHVQLRVEELRTESLLDALLRDDLDGGLAATPVTRPGVREIPLLREALYAYLPPNHALTARKRVRQRDLVNEDVWLLAEGHCFGDQVLHLCKVHRPVRGRGRASLDFRAGSFESLRGLVDAGLGITVLPELNVEALPRAVREAQVRPFALPEPVREVSLLRTREALRAPIAEALMQCVRDTVSKRMHQRARRGVGHVLPVEPAPA